MVIDQSMAARRGTPARTTHYTPISTAPKPKKKLSQEGKIVHCTTRIPASFLVLIAIASVAHAAEPAPQEPACRPERWATAMKKFQEADARNPPQAGGVLFVGSSSIRLWDLQKWFPDLQVVNRGFGGSEICDSVHYFDTLVAPHKPKVVVLYAGDNDVAGGKKAAQVLRDFRAFDAKLKQHLPSTRLIFIGIKPSLARWKLAPEMERTNEQIETLCGKNPQRLTFLEVWKPMLGQDGKPRKELFANDGLHLNDKGYALWTKLVQQQLQPKRK